MKQSQWILAAVVAAGLIFVVTFAMNYLGGSRQGTGAPVVQTAREIVFTGLDVYRQNPSLVPPPFGVLEREERTAGHVDFWFYNPNAEAVRVGLQHKNCKCGSVEVFVLPEERRAWIARSAAAVVGTAAANVLNPVALWRLAGHQIRQGVKGHELLYKAEQGSAEQADKVETALVPAGQVGWVGVGWSGRTGKQILEATLWFDDPNLGKRSALVIQLVFHEPFRVRSALRVETLRESDLEKGVRESIVVWSSTRDSLDLVAKGDGSRNSPESDPFIIGEPVLLTPDEYRALDKANNEGAPSTTEDTRGTIRVAYRIPLRLQAVARDGKTPFDIGPFSRRVSISSPDVTGDPKTVTVTGRVRGMIEMGNDGTGGRVDFGNFSRGEGSKDESVSLESRNHKVELTFDRQRTSRFLHAELVPVVPPLAGSLQSWTLRAKVLPREADGEFPRANDPLYEDSAIYLKVSFPGGGQKPRSVRIAVGGRATGR